MQVYSDMKDSGVAWLGKIPSNWPQKHARYLFRESKALVGDKWPDYELLSLTLRGIIPRSEVEGGKNPEKYDAYQIVHDNDLVMCLFDYDVTPRTVGRVTQTGMLTGAYTNLKPYEGVSTRYYNYFFLSLDSTKELLHLCTGLRNGISKPVFFGLSLPFPDYDTQEKIADFLDTETAQIDNLIAKQERLLELLEEKRRATITHAVTRGLNPSVELKETNIPWLGQIPAHWSVAKIRYLANLKTGSTPKDNEGINQEGDGSGWLTPGDFVTDLYINDWSKYVTASAQDKFKIRLFNSPSILFIGIGATAGKIGYVREPVYSNQQITAIMPNSKAVPEYMLYYLHTISGTMRSTASYATLPIINNQFLSTVMHPVPGLTEQREIAHYLDEQDKKVNKLKQKIQTQITLLRERRTSLISHAVTGKVKI